jgi:hypothetical protein
MFDLIGSEAANIAQAIRIHFRSCVAGSDPLRLKSCKQSHI